MAINFSTMKTQVALRLGNMQSSDPFYTYLGNWVNESANNVIMRALTQNPQKRLNLFPELRDKWTDLTTADTAYLSMPADMLILNSLFSFDKATAVDENADSRKVMTEIRDVQQWELQNWATTVTGYPRKWMRYGNRIQINPCPRTGYTTYVLMLGFARESALTGATDTFVMSDLWHPAVVDYAVYLGATWLGWYDDAVQALSACDHKLQECVSVMGRENATDVRPKSRVANDPTGR